jgi:hypothetical protein
MESVGDVTAIEFAFANEGVPRSTGQQYARNYFQPQKNCAAPREGLF